MWEYVRFVRLGADSGGTFTDLVGTDGRILKIPSTPHDPGAAVVAGVGRIDPNPNQPVSLLAHGTTVATNCLLERRGAVVALVTGDGFGDVVEIGRQSRPSLYDQWVDRPEPLVPRHMRIELPGRLDASGVEMEPLDLARLSVPDGTEAVAVCLLHSDLNPSHEQAVTASLRVQGWDVSASHEIAPEFREFERTSTTVVNAYLRPVCRPYLEGLSSSASEVAVMTSAGGLVDLETAAQVPAALLLSGPAGGVRAAAAVAAACGYSDAVSFDMGGTSTDVCLILDGEPAPASMREVDGHPIRLPSLDVHTIGSGGGSIATIDSGGALRVGPRSAGAVPGPACYGRGGTEPTVTDANVVLGRIHASASFPGLGVLDADAAARSFEEASLDASGVIDVVNAQMEQALRSVTVERGVDPAGLALVAFGGAGPLHACDLAEMCGIPVVIIPGAAGVLSAVGLLCSPRRHGLVRSWPTPLDHDGLDHELQQLAELAVERLLAGAAEVESVSADPSAADARTSGSAATPLRQDVTVTTWVDCRYAGQSHELQVLSVDQFESVHRSRNGYSPQGVEIEVVAFRAIAELPSPSTVEEILGSWEDAEAGQLLDGPVTGPQVVVRDDCTIWIPEGWVGNPGPLGSLVLMLDGTEQ